MLRARTPVVIIGILSGGMVTAGCQTGKVLTPEPASYIVTAAPLDVGVITPKLCIAIDPSKIDGVWWWHPGGGGCGTRSTFPDVFRGANGKVGGSIAKGDLAARFTVSLTSEPGTPATAEVLVRLSPGSMTSAASAATVPTASRSDLKIPEVPERSSRGGVDSKPRFE